MCMKISVVIPCYNEQEVLRASHSRFLSALSTMTQYEHELIYINDGSHDGTLSILESIAQEDTLVKIISFSRNFGHQNAVTAGLHHATGDYIIIIDVDLQDPPELIALMVEKAIQEKANVVYGVRNKREGESAFKLITAKLFYRILNQLSDHSFPVDTGDFRLIDRQVLEVFKGLREQHKYLRGLFSWIGFKQVPIYYNRDERWAGSTKYSFKKMVAFAMTGLFGFSKKPLKLAIALGSISIIIALLLTIWILYLNIFAPSDVVSGWSSTTIVVLFLGGIQLFSIGILGEYIGNIFDEAKGRPEYIIEKKLNL